MHTNLPRDRVEEFCRRWRIVEFALFGSVLTDDFRPDSDVDVLVTFAPDARHSLFDRAAMISELEEMFGRTIDLVEKLRIDNPYIRKHVLDHHRVIYVASRQDGPGSC
jgi:predicted nucleotidyltransferase